MTTAAQVTTRFGWDEAIWDQDQRDQPPHVVVTADDGRLCFVTQIVAAWRGMLEIEMAGLGYEPCRRDGLAGDRGLRGRRQAKAQIAEIGRAGACVDPRRVRGAEAPLRAAASGAGRPHMDADFRPVRRDNQRQTLRRYRGWAPDDFARPELCGDLGKGPGPGQSATCRTSLMIFGNATSLCDRFRADSAAVKAGGSQHNIMSARSHRIARSLSVSAPIGSATWRIGAATASICRPLAPKVAYSALKSAKVEASR